MTPDHLPYSLRKTLDQWRYDKREADQFAQNVHYVNAAYSSAVQHRENVRAHLKVVAS